MHKKLFFLLLASTFLITANTLTAALADTDTPPVNMTVESALREMMQGNQRFVAEHPMHPHQSHQRLIELSTGQHPFAAVLTCADSRIAPELVFDQGLGDIFDVRVAGNITDDAVLGSLEYAAEHLHVPLIMVLGHQNCGAVTATMNHAHPHNHINSIIRAIAPATKHADGSLEVAIRENVRRSVEELNKAPALKHLVEAGELKIIGGYYSLETGEVAVIDAPDALYAMLPELNQQLSHLGQ